MDERMTEEKVLAYFAAIEARVTHEEICDLLEVPHGDPRERFVRKLEARLAREKKIVMVADELFCLPDLVAPARPDARPKPKTRPDVRTQVARGTRRKVSPFRGQSYDPQDHVSGASNVPSQSKGRVPGN